MPVSGSPARVSFWSYRPSTRTAFHCSSTILSPLLRPAALSSCSIMGRFTRPGPYGFRPISGCGSFPVHSRTQSHRARMAGSQRLVSAFPARLTSSVIEAALRSLPSVLVRHSSLAHRLPVSALSCASCDWPIIMEKPYNWGADRELFPGNLGLVIVRRKSPTQAASQCDILAAYRTLMIITLPLVLGAARDSGAKKITRFAPKAWQLAAQ